MSLAGENIVIGGISYTLDLDDSSFKSKLGSASKDIDSFANQGMTKMADVGNALAKVLAGVGAGLLAAGGFAVKSAADIEMIRQSLDTLLGSAEKGRELFTQLQKMANVTPFETADLAKSAQTLLSYGIASKDIIPTIQRIGDISLGNKEKFNMLSLAFAQVASNGKLMGQDLLQMTAQGFNPLQIISEKTGKNMSYLRDEMAKGNITFAMVNDAFTSASSEGGKFYKGMENGSKTLTGVLSTLSDNVKITARSIVGLSETGDVVKGGLFDKLSQMAMSAITWLDANKQKITEIGQIIVSKLIVAFQMIIGAITSVVKFFKEHHTAAMALVIGLTAFAAVAMIAAAVMFVVANAIVFGIAAAIAFVAIQIAMIITHWKDFKEQLVNLGRIIVNVFTSMWESVKNAFIALWDWIAPFLEKMWVSITLPFRLMYAAIYLIFYGLYEFFKWIWGLIDQSIYTAIDGIHSWITAKFNAIRDFIIPIWNSVKDFLAGIWTSITGGVKNAFSAIYDHIVAPFQRAHDKVNEVMSGLASSVGGWFSGMLKSIKDGINIIIKPINKLIESYNKLPNTPDIPTIPYLAQGGIVTKPTIAMIGEAGPEAVVPLNKAGGVGNTINIKVGLFAGTASELRAIAEKIAIEQNRLNSARGLQL